MRNRKHILAAFLAAAMTLALCACSSGGSAAPAAAPKQTEAPVQDTAKGVSSERYGILWVELSPAYMDSLFADKGYRAKEGVGSGCLKPDAMGMENWYLELRSDGTGYLYWGENNHGPIDRWELDGEKLRFRAGVSDFEGTLSGGVLRAGVSDGFDVWFAAPGAEIPEVETISMEDYVTRLYGGAGMQAAAEDSDLPGRYHVYAMENGGYTVRLDDPETVGDMDITLSGDGTGSMLIDGKDTLFRWVQQEDGVMLYDESGTVPFTGVLELEPLAEGVLRLSYPQRGVAIIYARDGADTSWIETISVEEYRARTAA